MAEHQERAEGHTKRHRRKQAVVTEEKRRAAAEWTIAGAVEHAAKCGGNSEKAHREVAEALRQADRKRGE